MSGDVAAAAALSSAPAHIAPDARPVTYPVLLGTGEVRHARLRPRRHAFAYRTFFLMLPMRSLRRGGTGVLAHNRAGALSFWDCDHGDGRADALAWLDELLARAGIGDATGEAWLHCYPRVFGYTFKPVSFWYCHRPDGTLRAVVVEVNNTMGERHCYLLDDAAWGTELQAAKTFHVSPFCPVEGYYRFRFIFDPAREQTVARVAYDDTRGPLLQTSVSGRLAPLTARAARHALWRHPAMTLAIVLRIHWQAARLWLKNTPVLARPARPRTEATRAAPRQP